jgi:hypothetical protein
MSRFRRGHTKAAKVTAVIVQQMRKEYDQGATQGELSDKYGLSVVQIGRIVRGESWKQIAVPTYQEATDESAAMIDSAVPIELELPPDFLQSLNDLKHVSAMPEIPVAPEVAARMALFGAQSKPAIQAQAVEEPPSDGGRDASAPERGDDEVRGRQATPEQNTGSVDEVES